MEFIEGSNGIYRPIEELFSTPLYQQTLQICWAINCYHSQVLVLAELLRRQRDKQLPPEVTAEDMAELVIKQDRKSTIKLLLELELQRCEEETKLLIQLVWKVTTSLKMRDVEIEARRLLHSPETMPPHFKHPKIISQAEYCARTLTEQQQGVFSSKLLTPREVLMEVVPKVLQNFWLPPQCQPFKFPSEYLSNMAVGVTKSVQDRVYATLSSMLLQATFSRSIRDKMVLSIQGKVRQAYTEDVLVEKLNCFSAELLNTIAGAAAKEISALFEPQNPTEAGCSKAPAPSHLLTTSDGAPVIITAAQDCLTSSKAGPELPSREQGAISAPPTPISTDPPAGPVGQPEPHLKPAVISPLLFFEASPLEETNDPLRPTLILLPGEASVPHDEDVCDGPHRESSLASYQPSQPTTFDKPSSQPTTFKKLADRLLYALLTCCWVLPEHDD